MTEFPTLVSPRCIVNCITGDDIPEMREIFDDELTKRYLPELKSLTRSNDKIKQMLKSFDVLFARNEGIIWGVRSSNTLVGFVAIIDISFNPTLIYATHPAYRQKGFMRECVPLLVRKAFESTKCSYILSEVHNDNKVSIGLLQSVGFCIVNRDRKKTYLRKIKDTPLESFEQYDVRRKTIGNLVGSGTSI